MDILLTITIIKCGINYTVIIPTLEIHFFIQVYIKSKFCEVSLLLLIIVKDLWINVAFFLTLTCMILVTHYLLWTCMVSKD